MNVGTEQRNTLMKTLSRFHTCAVVNEYNYTRHSLQSQQHTDTYRTIVSYKCIMTQTDTEHQVILATGTCQWHRLSYSDTYRQWRALSHSYSSDTGCQWQALSHSYSSDTGCQWQALSHSYSSDTGRQWQALSQVTQWCLVTWQQLSVTSCLPRWQCRQL